MSDPVPRGVKSIKSRLDTIVHQSDTDRKFSSVPKVQSHFLVAPNKLDKVTRRVIAPYAQIERKGLKEEVVKEGTYLDINRFNIFLEETVDLDSLLYDTANVLKTVTNSSGKCPDKMSSQVMCLGDPKCWNGRKRSVGRPSTR